jgi:hypothetical protein
MNKLNPARRPSPDRPARLRARSSDGGEELFHGSESALAKSCPETTLLCAVLEDAFHCFQSRFEHKNPDSRRVGREAEAWFFSNSRDLFSFLGVCSGLGIEPECIRKKLRGWQQDRLNRLCARWSKVIGGGRPRRAAVGSNRAAADRVDGPGY